MDSFIPQGGFQLPFQRRLSRLYNDTKKSSDFVKEPVQSADDPEIKALHRKLRIQKDRLVSWGLEWSDPNQTAEIDESLSKAGLSDLVGSIMATIKDILAEAEPLWLASKGNVTGGTVPEKTTGDKKTPLIVWDKGRFEDLVRDLTASIDTLCDLSRTRSEAAMSSRAAQSKLAKSTASIEDLQAFESTRIRTPQVISPSTLTTLNAGNIDPGSTASSPARPQQIVFMDKQAYSELTRQPGRQTWSPLLLEYAQFDQIYSLTGIMPAMSRFEKLSAGLQTDSHRSPGAWIGLPLLLGYFEDMENSRLALVYQFPSAFNPVSFENFTHTPLDNLCTLADLLNRPDFEPRLEAKFRLAHNLANTVFDMHARGITHGNLLDTSVSFCSAPDSATSNGEVDIRKPLLSSFDLFPDSFTPDPSSSPPFLSLHRHPLDPRTSSQSPLASLYDMKTLDLYSLAMLLVSIGLWTKLENLVPDQTSPSIPESVLEQLAIQCGTPYMRAVQACWNAVDQELSRPGASEDVMSHVQMRASRYLEACCILDGVSGLDERLGDEPVTQPSASQPKSKTTASPYSNPDHKSPVTFGADTKPIPKESPSSTGPDIKQPIEAFETEHKKGTPSKERSPKLRLYPQVPLPDDAIEQWNIEISLECIGESPQKVTPTVLVVCTSVNKVRAILKKRLGVLFDGGASELDSENEADAEDENEHTAINPDFQDRPRNGASIESGSDDFTCEFSDSESESEFSATDITSDDEDDEEDRFEEYGEPGDIPGVEPGCGDGYVVTQPALDDVEEGFYPSEDTMDEDHLDTYSVGEVYASSGIRRRHENGLVHEIDWALFEFHDDRQPGDNFIPRARAQNTPSSSPVGDLHPTTVAPATSLPGMEVQCSARTSGLQTGQILPALTSVKIYGRASPSHTYQVSDKVSRSASSLSRIPALQHQDQGPRSGSSSPTKTLPLGIPGDSGAWVIDRRTGRLAGHVLAWSERKQVAYICPMDVLLLDIAETLEAAEVRLPGGDTIIRLLANEGTAAALGRRSDDDIVDVGEDFSELNSMVDCEEEVDKDEDKDGKRISRLDQQKQRPTDDLSAAMELKKASPTPASGPPREDEHDYDASVRALTADMDKVHIPGTEIGVGSR
ncbi:putative het-s domain protein [Eutypa lata UCREL1]|uniref:Putative het-s domain protein n=1 Tax=Eutypa lata (strain UCR-EL1) TaxID=1287681 RepID=M7T7V2_EUTLA|nr:putative het-s domain protein [Eutypa lata UCREL1]